MDHVKSALLGKKAFEDGATCTPVFDIQLMLLIEKGSNTILLLDSWTDAWHKANLEAPVEY